ncbi:MAG: alpha-amylase family glycosyl hydrolase [Gammaproteobacteria bacterium]|nr:alpha-amylase family glycosyl hydrolase [Gammaproteobacteria bacterium]MDE0270287.1 alpha-amylase family glycosyl hydrolase [Gammaproteobacteria bacterium]
MNKLLLNVALAGLASVVAASAASEEAGKTCRADELLLQMPSPNWQDQVIYMLFIDRFQDGDPTNNDQGHGEYEPLSGAHFSGGDLKGIVDRLDYLKSLGVTAVWITPPVTNQWWSTPYQAAGWHGYWAINFREIDPHFGTLVDYQRLSHELHCRGMFLVQDIVANHTANFYTYDGGYDPADTAKNFRLLEPSSHQPAPTQPPFHMIGRLNPEHASANIYHWTPTLQDFADRHQETHYMLGQLADLNTENPVVIAELKDTYKHWISEAGVDAFRIDTVSLVDHEFWHRFLHDGDGIYAHAQGLGKRHFLTFGESVSYSEPFGDGGEQKLKGYLGSKEKPYVNSMLNYPLYFEVNRVIGRGQATSQLAFRLQRFMSLFDDPFNMPNFIDNHDTPRFLATGNTAAFEQALALLFTIPGIPIIYQGTEQALKETRMAMFAGGHNNQRGSFDSDSRPYQLIQSLAAVRRSNPILSRGDLSFIASDSAGPGILAYQRTLGKQSVTVLMNTADHAVLAHRLHLGAPPGGKLDAAFTSNIDTPLAVGTDGQLTATLPARSVFISAPYEAAPTGSPTPRPRPKITITPPSSRATFSETFQLSGHAAAFSRLLLIRNGNIDAARPFQTNADGNWAIEVPVVDFGRTENHLQVYDAENDRLSDRFFYVSEVTQPALERVVSDPIGDDVGPEGRYIKPLQPLSRTQKDILGARVRTAGRNLELTLTMGEVSNSWLPMNGFDNVVFSIFIDTDARAGLSTLPKLNASMPATLRWDLAHVASGWASYLYDTTNAAAGEQGDKLGVSPRITADAEARTVTFLYEGERFGVDDWQGANLYVTTWEHNPEGEYTEINESPSDWSFGGAPPTSPKILDDLLIEGQRD